MSDLLSWLRDNQRMMVPVLATLLLPAFLFLYVAGELWSLRAGHQAQIESLEPRIARLQGLLEHEGALREAVNTVGADVTDLVYPADEDHAAVAASLQRNLRERFADSGLKVTNSQIVAVREGERFDRVAVKLTLSGTLAALDDALAGVAQQEPLLLVEELDVWPTRQRKEQQQQEVTATVQVLALKVRQ